MGNEKAPGTLYTPTRAFELDIVSRQPLQETDRINGKEFTTVKIIASIRYLIDTIHVARMRREVLNRKLEGLTNHGLIDRMLASEEEN